MRFTVPKSPARGRRRPGPVAGALVSYLIIASSVGCGGSQSGPIRSDEPAPSTAPPASVPGGALSAQLARTLPRDAASTAVVSFAVFRAAPIEDHDRATKLAAKRFDDGFLTPPGELKSFVAGSPPQPTVIPAAVDADLPLDVGALAAGAGDARPAIEGARSVFFVRYAGRALDDAGQVKGAALGATLLADPGDAVVDLGTRRIWTAEGFAEWMATDGWLADQVVVDAQQADDGTVTFFTRGMARFGQPDLEATGVAPADARARFAAFQALLTALRAHGPAKPGDAVGGVILGRCARPAEAIERTCVAM